jgi:hypothetical protein
MPVLSFGLIVDMQEKVPDAGIGMRTLTGSLLFMLDEYLLGESRSERCHGHRHRRLLAHRFHMLNILLLAGVIGFVAATAALWARGRVMVDRRVFAGLVSLAVTVILFSLIGWLAALFAIAPRDLTWVFVGALAVLFALRLYKELRSPATIE